MAVSLSVVVAKDGAGATIVGGLQAQDKSGAGTGPFTLGHIMIDGLAGTNMAAVTAANAVKVDGSAVTQPVSLTSTTITGTVAATQSGAWQITNSGNSAQAQVVANGDALANQVGVSANSQTQVYNGTTWDRLRGDTTAGAFVQIKNAAGSPGNVKLTDGTNAVAVKAASTAPAATDPAIVAAISPNSYDFGSGTSGTKTQRVIVDSSQLSALGRAAAASSAPIALSTEDNALLARLLPTVTASGATASRVNAAATTNATSLKASAGQLYTIDVFNAAAYNVFLKLYNKASAPTVGTDTPVMTIPVQAGGGFSKSWLNGLTFATGIAYAITKLQADSDTTAVVAGDLTGNTTWI